MKAILVLDEMPNSCIDCRFCREIDEGVNACCEIMDKPNNKELCRIIDVSYPQEKPNWCPLKQAPERSLTGLSDKFQWGDWEDGYNACIDEILGDKE